jgi:tRNA threonylcarbamoyladenosine biosynthesis protein TsaB
VNPLILAVDTTREFGSVALLRDAELLEEILIHAPDGFSGVLYEHLRRMLERHGVAVNEITCFAAASGPGSFTGVRVGLACVQGLAEATGGKMVAVSNLEVLASFGTAPLRAVVLDARRGEVYCALYDAQGEAILPESVGKFPAWLERQPQGEIEFVASDFAPFALALAATRFADSKITMAPRALAGAIGRIALERFRAGLARNPASIEPNYVRRSDAELLWKDQ